MTTTTKKTLFFDELQLIRAAQKDKKAMEKLLMRLHPRVNQVAWSMVRSKEQAEEIEQAAMLEILKYAGRYRGEGSLEAWAGEITYRTGMKMLKRSHLWKSWHLPISEVHQEPVQKPNQDLFKKRTYAMLEEKMERLPEVQRTAFVLHTIYGHTVDEVSKIMKVSSNTIKYRLKSAVRGMRAIFDENPELREAISEARK